MSLAAEHAAWVIAQSEHVVQAVEPTVLAYEPAAHAVHALVPVASELYAPTTHAVQTRDVDGLATSLYLPATHDVQAPALYAPKEQLVHTSDVAAPSTPPNKPDAHAVQLAEVATPGRVL